MKKFFLVILVLCFILIISKAVSAVTLTNTISVSVFPDFLAIDEKTNKIYATSFPSTAMSIEVIDGSTDTLLTTIPIDAGENATLSGIVANSNTGTVYVEKSTSFESRDNKIFIIDGSSNMVTGEIITEPYGLFGHIALDQTANRIYVNSNNSVTGGLNSVTAIDATSKTILHSLELMGSPGKMVVDSSKNRVYAINTIANEIFVLEFDTNSNKLSLIATINIEGGGGPQSIALIPAVNRLFVDSLNSEFVYVINTNTNEVTEKIPGRKKNDEVDSLGVNPKTNKLYVAYKKNESLKTSDEIVIYDATTLAIDDKINVDFDSVEFFTNQTTNKVYVAASLNSTTPIYVLSDGSITSGGSSTSSGGTSSSDGSIFLTSFKSDIKEMIEAVKDLKILNEVKNSAKDSRKSLVAIANDIIRQLNFMKAGLRAPKLVCQGVLLGKIGVLNEKYEELIKNPIIKGSQDFNLLGGSTNVLSAEGAELIDRISTTFNEIKTFATIDDDKNGFSDICEQRKK